MGRFASCTLFFYEISRSGLMQAVLCIDKITRGGVIL